MNYRILGNTGLSVSEISIGCSGYEGKSKDDICDELHYAMSKGVNFIDLFASDPEMRSSLGVAIAGRRKDIIIQGHLCSAWKNNQYLRTRDLELTKASFEDLLERLDTDYVDIGMIHYVDTILDWEEILNGPLMEYFKELKQKRRIHHLGLSSHNPEVAIAAVSSGLIDVLMFAINPCYDMQPPNEDVEQLWAPEKYAEALINQDSSRKELYELCESRGVAIDVMKAYGGGDLLSEELSPFGKAFTAVQCLHYALTRPSVVAVMTGYKGNKELDDALEYLGASTEEKDYSGVLATLDKHSFKGNCLYCGHCAPCPMGIDVAAVTKLLNICVARGSVPETERNHYLLLEHHACECVYCGLCEENCPFDVDIIENIEAAEKMFGM